MAVDEVSRHELVGKLQEVLGPRPAATFMEMYPLLGDEIATKQHVAAETAAVRQDVAAEAAAVRQDVAAEAAAVRQDVADFKHQVANEFASVRHDMASEFASVRHELASTRQEAAAMKVDLHKDMDLLRFELLAAFRGEINTALTSQMRSIVFANTSLFVAFAGLVWSLKVF